MTGTGCWAIEDYAYRPCPEPAREFHFAVSPHNHSCHSIENLASLNQVVKLWFMRPFRQVLQWAFGLAAVRDLDYADVYYRAPLTVEDVFLTESAGVAPLGFDGVHLGITDHDEVAGSVELLRRHPANAHRTPLGEELSIRFQNYLFHLGVTDLPESGVEETHACLQAAARAERLDDLFEILRASGCLVVLNHPLVPWAKDKDQDNDPHRKIPVEDLLRRYGWAIHALEYNGMRGQKENDRVLELAKHVNKARSGWRRQPSSAREFRALSNAGRELSGFCGGSETGPRRASRNAAVLCALALETLLARALFYRPLPADRPFPRAAGSRSVCGQSRVSGSSRRCFPRFSAVNLVPRPDTVSLAAVLYCRKQKPWQA